MHVLTDVQAMLLLLQHGAMLLPLQHCLIHFGDVQVVIAQWCHMLYKLANGYVSITRSLVSAVETANTSFSCFFITLQPDAHPLQTPPVGKLLDVL